MRTSCVKNGLVVGVILLFIAVAVQPVIIADVSKEPDNSELPDLAIVKIFPYYWVYIESGIILMFTPVILVKDAKYNGIIRIEGQIQRLGSTIPVYTEYTIEKGSYEEGCIITLDRYGMGSFDKIPIGIYEVSFTIIPEEEEANKLNNKRSEFYFIWGQFNLRGLLIMCLYP